MWWRWAIVSDTGAYSSGGASFSTAGHALDAALRAAMLKNREIAEIYVFTLK